MKIRKGFVSNSSSSSFVCDISGEVFGGYDCGLGDFDMCECVKGHTFVYDGYEKAASWVAENDNYSVPAELCPICTGEAKSEITKRILADMKKLGLTTEDLIAASAKS